MSVFYGIYAHNYILHFILYRDGHSIEILVQATWVQTTEHAISHGFLAMYFIFIFF